MKSRPQLNKATGLSKNIIRTLFLQGGAQVSVILLSAYLARSFPPRTFGEYAFGFHFAMLVATIACMGSATILAKSWGESEGSAYYREGEIFARHNYLLLRGFLLISCVTLVYFPLSDSIVEVLSYLVVFSLYIVMQLFNYYAATDRAPIGNGVQFSRATVTLIAAVGASWYLDMSMTQIVGLALAASTTVATIFLFRLGLTYPIKFIPSVSSDLTGFTLQHWASVLLLHADILIIKVLLDSESVAQYAIALFYSSACTFGLYAINSNTIAKISDGARRLPREQLQVQLTHYAKISLIVSAFFIGAVLLVAQLTNVVFGDYYTKSYYIFLILLVGQVFNVLSGSVALILNIFGHSTYVSRAMLMALIVKLCVAFLFVPAIGLWAVAIATSIATGLWNVWLLYIVLKHLHINPTVFSTLGASSDAH